MKRITIDIVKDGFVVQLEPREYTYGTSDTTIIKKIKDKEQLLQLIGYVTT